MVNILRRMQKQGELDRGRMFQKVVQLEVG